MKCITAFTAAVLCMNNVTCEHLASNIDVISPPSKFTWIFFFDDLKNALMIKKSIVLPARKNSSRLKIRKVILWIGRFLSGLLHG